MNTIKRIQGREKRGRGVSVDDILKAGGADTYALKKGIDTRTRRLSGRVRIKLADVKTMLTQLKNQK